MFSALNFMKQTFLPEIRIILETEWVVGYNNVALK